MNQRNEPGRRQVRIVAILRLTDAQGRRFAILPGDADVTQPAQVVRNLVQLRVGIRRLGETGNDHLDEFARQPDDALIFRLNARRGLEDKPRDVDGEAERQNQRQKQVDPRAKR